MMRDNELIGDCALDSRKYNHSHRERRQFLRYHQNISLRNFLQR